MVVFFADSRKTGVVLCMFFFAIPSILRKRNKSPLFSAFSILAIFQKIDSL